MFYRRIGFPEEGELVLCTVTKVQSHSVFVRLDEFDRSGMIHISEVSPGRIRNIRDFVKEDKIVVCQVLRINRERGYIDLSLRRVNDNQRRKKIEQIKQEQKAEKIVETISQQLKKNPEQLYQEIFSLVSKQYSYLHDCFQDIAKGEMTLADLGITGAYTKELEEMILQRMKPKEVYIGGKLTIQSYAPNGVTIIKDALLAGKNAGKEQLTINYLGAGAFNILVRAEEYKEAEKILDKTLQTVQGHVPKGKATITFLREEKKSGPIAA